MNPHSGLKFKVFCFFAIRAIQLQIRAVLMETNGEILSLSNLFPSGSGRPFPNPAK
jgi:hypothetical protein